MTVLHVAKYAPVLAEAECRLDKSASVKFAGIGIVVFQVTVGEVFVCNLFIGNLCDVSEVVSCEILQ